MCVTFKVKLRDYLWFVYYCMFPGLRRASWLIPALCLCGLFVARRLMPEGAWVATLQFVAIATVATLLLPFFSTLVLYPIARVCLPKGAKFSHELALALAEERILVRSPRTEMTIAWHDVRKVVQTTHYLILRFQEFGVLVIPRRAFQSEEQWSSFYRYCERKTSVG